jgi:hypothetical protein
MASQLDRPKNPHTFRFEFDPANKILLAKVVGRFSEQAVAEYYEAVRKHSIATDARAGILDLSTITEVAVSSEFIRRLADREPAMPDAARRPRFIVAPAPLVFGIARMFQIVGERTRPLLEVVRTVDEALAKLGVQSTKFEPLD